MLLSDDLRIGPVTHPGKGFRQLAPSAASDKSDVTRAEGGGAVSTLGQLDLFYLHVTNILAKNTDVRVSRFVDSRLSRHEAPTSALSFYASQ